MGNGHPVTIQSVGTTTLYTTHNPNLSFTLKNLLCVPTLTRNLIYVGQFTLDNNVYFEFHPFTCLVKSHVSKQVLLKGFRGVDGLYFLPSLAAVTQPTAAAALSVTVSPSSSFVVVYHLLLLPLVI